MWDSLASIFSGLLQSTGATGVMAFIGEAWLSVSDYRMWRSLGWTLLGVVLIIIGFVIWNRHAIGAAATTLAETA